MSNLSPESSPSEAPSSSSSSLLERSLLSFALLLAVFALCVPSIPSADMWWHLSTGQYILHTHSIPHADPFSSTFAGKPWTTHEWLSDVLFYYVYSLADSPGLLCFCGAILALAFWFAFRSISGPLLSRLLALGLGIWAARPSFSVRPLVFTLLLAALFLYFLRRFIARGRYRELKPDEDGLIRSRVFPGLWLDPATAWNLKKSVREGVRKGLASPEHAAFARRLEAARKRR